MSTTPHKILIFGNSGSGKSTLARKLVSRKNLAHLDLDTLAWLPTDPPLRAPLHESAQLISQFTNQHAAWVIEGCYTDLLELVGEYSTEIIFMDLSVEQCIENARNRPWESHKYSSKEAQDNNLEMLVSWIKAYATREDEFSYQTHVSFYENFTNKKSRYLNNQQSQLL